MEALHRSTQLGAHDTACTAAGGCSVTLAGLITPELQ